MPTVLIYLTMILLIVATITDIRTRHIPNWLTYSGIAIASVLLLLDPPGILYLIFGLIPFVALRVTFIFTKKIGGGDIKLFLFLGLALGGVAPILILCFTFILLTMYQIANKIHLKREVPMPLAPFILASTVILLSINFYIPLV